MALLTILLLVFAVLFSSFGSSSSGSSSSGRGTAEPIKPVIKCSQRMPAETTPAAQERRCGPPPANP
jgi:hypothetical protein